MGPTASGKTDLAVGLVQELGCEIVSVDSALVYRQLNIGAAKPDCETLAIAPHRLINIRNVEEAYSAAEFVRDAEREIAAIQARGKIPLLVGGTMLYFKALQQGLAEMPAADAEIRARLQVELEQHGLAAMHGRLQDVDPKSAARIHPHDSQRIQRALEVWDATGIPLSEHHQAEAADQSAHDFIKLVYSPPNASNLARANSKSLAIDAGARVCC